MIYLVSGTPYSDDLLSGYATDAEGIKRLVQNHLNNFCYDEEFDITVDLEKSTVTVIELEDYGYETTYYIFKEGKA